jgi:hypothetical protein
MDIKTELHNLKTMVLTESHISDLSKKNIADRIFQIEKGVVMNYIPCCETLNNEGQATLTEYATELINMQENPQDSNKDWKIVVMQNTIGKLHETIKSL